MFWTRIAKPYQVLSVFASEAKMKKIELRLQFGETINQAMITKVQTDHVRLGQVVTNLISNAIRFTASSGESDLQISIARVLTPQTVETLLSSTMSRSCRPNQIPAHCRLLSVCQASYLRRRTLQCGSLSVLKTLDPDLDLKSWLSCSNVSRVSSHLPCANCVYFTDTG
jgi:hypothetical protein